MTGLLIKLFIGNGDLSRPAVRRRYAMLASITGIAVNLLLFAGKLTAGILALSVAVVADAFNNVSDAGSSVIALVGFRLSGKREDKSHPLGHGRIEYITGFIVGLLIIFVGAEFFISSAKKIINPVLPSVSALTLGFLAVSILIKFWLFFFYRKIGNLINSSAIKAAASDSISDAVATTLVLVSSLTAKYAGVPVDGWAGILVACFILFTGVKAAKETADLLLGAPPDPAFVEKIYAFVKNYSEVIGIHDVMIHDYGPERRIVSFHAEVPSDCDICYAHDVIDCIERDMHAQFGCLVTIHLDPIVVNDEHVNEMRSLAEKAAADVNPAFTIHDFRMTSGGKHVNMIFDLLIPPDCKMTCGEAAEAVAKRIKEKNPDCYAVIDAEHPFV